MGSIGPSGICSAASASWKVNLEPEARAGRPGRPGMVRSGGGGAVARFDPDGLRIPFAAGLPDGSDCEQAADAAEGEADCIKCSRPKPPRSSSSSSCSSFSSESRSANIPLRFWNCWKGALAGPRSPTTCASRSFFGRGDGGLGNGGGATKSTFSASSASSASSAFSATAARSSAPRAFGNFGNFGDSGAEDPSSRSDTKGSANGPADGHSLQFSKTHSFKKKTENLLAIYCAHCTPCQTMQGRSKRSQQAPSGARQGPNHQGYGLQGENRTKSKDGAWNTF